MQYGGLPCSYSMPTQGSGGDDLTAKVRPDRPKKRIFRQLPNSKFHFLSLFTLILFLSLSIYLYSFPLLTLYRQGKDQKGFSILFFFLLFHFKHIFLNQMCEMYASLSAVARQQQQHVACQPACWLTLLYVRTQDYCCLSAWQRERERETFCFPLCMLVPRSLYTEFFQT